VRRTDLRWDRDEDDGDCGMELQADSTALLERHLTVTFDNELLPLMGPKSSWAHARYQTSHAMPIQWTVMTAEGGATAAAETPQTGAIATTRLFEEVEAGRGFGSQCLAEAVKLALA